MDETTTQSKSMAHRLKESLEENPSTTAKLLPSCPTTVGDEVLAMLK